MDTRTSFTYDPQRQGYSSSLWKTLTGTPATAYVVFADIASDADIDLVYDAVSIADSVTITNTTVPLSFTEAVTLSENVAVTVA